MTPTTTSHQSPISVPTMDGTEPESEGVPPELWFDRSSITADAMVTIVGVSEEEWWKFAPEDQICEFFDGVVYMPSPATDEHQDEVSFWFDILNGFRISTKASFRVRMGPAVLRLASGQCPEPDLFVVPKGPGPHSPPALLVVEVFSKSTKGHDQGLKAERYRAAGVPEFVHLDLERERMLVHRATDAGYSTEILERGIWNSTSIEGFWLNVEWLWNYDEEDPRARLVEILAGAPG
jgi:Uma2 family endonuclease